MVVGKAGENVVVGKAGENVVVGKAGENVVRQGGNDDRRA